MGASPDVSRSFRLDELAAAVGGEVIGDPETRIAGVRTLERAGPDDLSLFTRASYRGRLGRSRAGALLVPPNLAQPAAAAGRPLVVVAEPALALAKLVPLFHPSEPPAPGVHPTAVVGERCEIDPEAHLGPYAVVGDRSSVAAGAPSSIPTSSSTTGPSAACG